MIHIAFAFLGAALTLVILLIAVGLLSESSGIPRRTRALLFAAFLLPTIGVWMWVDGQWEYWSERAERIEICYPDGGYSGSPECLELTESGGDGEGR